MAQEYEQLLLKNQLCFPLYACSRKIVSNYTPLLKRMETAGYVTRKRSREDERITIVSITPEGEKLKEKCSQIPAKLAEKGFPLSEKEAGELYRLHMLSSVSRYNTLQPHLPVRQTFPGTLGLLTGRQRIPREYNNTCSMLLSSPAYPKSQRHTIT